MRRRAGGRSARMREAVVAVTVAEFQETGYDKLSIAAVAAPAKIVARKILENFRHGLHPTPGIEPRTRQESK
jgi:AcrR family transcriptional regulator